MPMISFASVGTLPRRLDRQIPEGLLDADGSRGTDPVAVEEDNDYTHLRPLLPNIGDPFPAFRPDNDSACEAEAASEVQNLDTGS